MCAHVFTASWEPRFIDAPSCILLRGALPATSTSFIVCDEMCWGRLRRTHGGRAACEHTAGSGAGMDSGSFWAPWAEIAAAALVEAAALWRVRC